MPRHAYAVLVLTPVADPETYYDATSPYMNRHLMGVYPDGSAWPVAHFGPALDEATAIGASQCIAQRLGVPLVEVPEYWTYDSAARHERLSEIARGSFADPTGAESS